MRPIIIFAFLLISVSVFAQRKITRQEYINQYKDLAMEEMDRTGIPASITMAQGILESGDGNSRLATKANNHFGIKCHDWKGKSVKHDDDKKNECFRKYKDAEESYRDHSDFLTGRTRYTFLFEYDVDNYKAWAKGLKKAGYATSPTYAKALIRVIEENNLYELDEQVIAGRSGRDWNTVAYAGSSASAANGSSYSSVGQRKLYLNNRVKYIMAREGETFESIAEELNMMSWQLPKYNELPRNEVLTEGQIIYLQPKRSKAETGKKVHVVSDGETLYDISQKYAVKMDKLMTNNGLENESSLTPGTQIHLRSRNKNITKTVKEQVVFTTKEKETQEDDGEDFEVIFDY